MNRRIRFAGAVIALVALSAYFAESVRASMCLPGMDMGMAGEVAADAHANMEHGPADDSQAPSSESPQCPLGMAGAGSTCVVLLMPAMTATSLPALEADVAGAVFVDGAHDLVISATQFRPPRT